ncbi:MAG: DUF7682 family zinc-binding protein [Thainema sp.]
MSRRSRKHKKRFRCGHRGFGRYCHCCADRARHKQQALQKRQAKRQNWAATFSADVIDLSELPKAIVKKARQVLSALNQGTSYWQLSGKRLKMSHDVIRIPVTDRYRLLCHDDGDQVTPMKVISHEEYNPLTKSPKRLIQRLFSRKR